jgi:hypothetical protein
LVDYICYKPDDILLKLYEEDFGRQYLVKSERASKEYFSLIFGYKADSLPRKKLLSPGPGDIGAQTDSTDWFFCEKNPTNDSLVYWIKDSSIYRCDTLHIQLDYLKTDSNNILSAVRDTLRLFTRKPQLPPEETLRPRAEPQRQKRSRQCNSIPADRSP